MRVRWKLPLYSGIFVFLFAVMVSAQDDSTCELDATEIVAVVESVCSTTGNNELCYGNNDVAVETRENSPAVNFSSPGDLMSVNYVQSLYLSALDQVADVWGVAQMRLITTTVRGPREVTLLLYGDVEVDNAVEPTTTIMVQTTASINIRSIPRLNGAVLASAPRGTGLEAVGRLEDTSWIRVIVPETEAVGWLAADFVEPVNSDESFESLDIMESDDTYFGPMQAFYINTGTNLSCDNVATDGLIIQTPEGTARVTILINEVSIELISPDGASATAMVTANQIDGMTINVMSGTALVEANGSAYYVNPGSSTNIGMTSDMTPDGTLTEPIILDPAELLDIPLLTVNTDSINPTGITDAYGNDISNGTGQTDASGNPITGANGNGQGDGNINSQGDINRSEGNATGSDSSQGSGQATGNAGSVSGNGSATGQSGGSTTGGN